MLQKEMIVVSLRSNDITNEYFSTIVMHHRVLQLLNDELIRIIGPKAASALNYQQGIRVGNSLVGKFNMNLSINQLMIAFKLFFKIARLSGMIEDGVKVVRKGNTIVGITKTTISNRRRKYVHPTCSFVAGEVKAIAEHLTGRKWSCVETKCYSLGDKYDEFLLKPEE